MARAQCELVPQSAQRFWEWPHAAACWLGSRAASVYRARACSKIATGVSVDALGSCATLLVDRLGCLRIQARPPGDHFGRVIGSWGGSLTSTRQRAWRPQWRVHAGSTAFEGGDVIAFHIAAVDQVLSWVVPAARGAHSS